MARRPTPGHESASESAMRRPAARGVRFQTTLAATLVVAATLALAAVAFVLLQRSRFEASLTELADQQAADVAAQAADEGATGLEFSRVGAGERSMVQVVGPSGEVLLASTARAGERALVASRPPPGSSVTVRVNVPDEEETEFVAVAKGVATPAGPMVVIAAQSLEPAAESTAVAVGLLAVGLPAVLLVVAGTCYWLTGRALAPVEAMRRKVAGISSSDLSARVPVPPAGDELTRLAETMNAMLGRLEASSQVQRRFVADASHELRSPIATIRTELEVARRHADRTDWEAVSADALAETERLHRLVSDLLLLARADERTGTLRREDVDLDDLMLDEARRLRAAGVAVDVQSPPVRVVGDGAALARAVRNLVDNAVLHGGSRVSLLLRADRAQAVMEVVDDGPGIPVDQRERVFDRFVRLDASRERAAGGTGLGLPIAREIARAHGGDVTVGNGATGARLVLTLPLPDDLAPHGSRPSAD
ncbi:ATP-binding protein [Georgenia yuyongxinii]|uniref:histidine kinase n=1 Tax=Georgenia yuyongxinii TaxID=2589797 RepID=A0A552WV57_9MICO|nr:ATP-binding protein [Georgenia yuyongxinii]TRW46728.1 HAMP domain-containing protein [Georgenia yuyongxinii]